VVLGVLMVLAAWSGSARAGCVKGSFMTGDMHWFWIGARWRSPGWCWAPDPSSIAAGHKEPSPGRGQERVCNRLRRASSVERALSTSRKARTALLVDWGHRILGAQSLQRPHAR